MTGFYWPADVDAYLTHYGHDLARARPEMERKAREHAEPLVDVLEGLGASPFSLLDIGCGLALVDIHLVRAFPTLRRVTLLDGDGTVAKQPVGFRHDTRAWQDVGMGAAMLEANTRPDVAVSTLAPEPFGFMFAGTFDLVVSFRSWCHHYPADIYLASVLRTLAPGGGSGRDGRAPRNGRAGPAACGRPHCRRDGAGCVGEVCEGRAATGERTMQVNKLRKRPFPQRFLNAYRVYRNTMGMSWWTAAIEAWHLSRL